MTGRPALRALAVLAFVELAAFGLFAGRIGFYHDDWVLNADLALHRGFWAQVAALRWLAPRPLDIPQAQLFFALGGLHPLPYHLIRLALDLASGWLFYLLLDRLTGRRALALTAAALAMLLPNREALHFWLGIGNEGCAMVLMFGSLLAFLDWLDKKSASRLVLALALYLASVLTYEALAFFPLVLVAARPKDWLRFWPFGPLLGAGLLWERVGAAKLEGVVNTKAMGFSVLHALKVFGAGFECNFNRVLHIGALSWVELIKEAPALLAPAALAAGAVALLLKERDEDSRPRPAARVALALFIAAYLPYAATVEYTPQIFGLMSRTNAAGAWAGGLALALLLSRAPYRKAVLFAFVLFFVGADWQRARVWGQAWDAQKKIIEGLKTKDIPRGSVVLLANAPNDVGRVPVFEAGYAFAGALRATLGRSDLEGDLLRAYRGPVDQALVYDGETGVLKPAK